MAPKKRKADEEPVELTTKTSSTARVTRSSTRRANGSILADSMAVVLPTQVPKKTHKKGKASTTEEKISKLGVSSKTIVIEHCKQCNSFKTRAMQVKTGLENGVADIQVLVNPAKPRRGCFEIRVEGGEKFISLLEMKRPFAPMKALDMVKVIEDIVDKIK